MIMPNDSTRARSKPQMPLGLTAAGAFQIRSRSLCNSANTVVAPISNVTTLINVAMTFWSGWLALLSKPSIAVAPSFPIRPSSSPTI